MPTPVDLFRFWAVGNLWFWMTAWQSWERNTLLAIDTAERIAKTNNKLVRQLVGASEDKRTLLPSAVIAELERRRSDLRARRMELV